MVRILNIRNRLSICREPPILSVFSQHLRLNQSDIEWSGVAECLVDVSRPIKASPSKSEDRKSSSAPLPVADCQPSQIPNFSIQQDQVSFTFHLDYEKSVRASIVIAKFYRMYRVRKWYRKWRTEELMFLGAFRADPCIARALHEEADRLDIQQESAEFFENEVDKQLSIIQRRIERELQTTFVEPSLLSVWKYFELNGEFPKDIQELLSCMEKGDLRKLVVVDVKNSKKTAIGTKKKEAVVKPLEVPRDMSLDALVDAVDNFQFKVGFCEVNEEQIREEMKKRMIREILEPELEKVSGMKSVREKGVDTRTLVESMHDILFENEGVLFSDIFRDRDTIEETFGEDGRRRTRSSVCVKLVEEIVLPLGSGYVCSRCPMQYRTILLYGPPRCGKKRIMSMISTESNAPTIDFHLLMKQPKEGIWASADKLKTIADKNVVPLIVFISEIESLVLVSSSKGAPKKNAANGRNVKPFEVLAKVIECLKGSRSLVVASCSDPACDTASFAPLFEKKMYVGPPNEQERLEASIALCQTSGVSIGGMTTSQRESLVSKSRKIDGISMGSLVEKMREHHDRSDSFASFEKPDTERWAKFMTPAYTGE